MAHRIAEITEAGARSTPNPLAKVRPGPEPPSGPGARRAHASRLRGRAGAFNNASVSGEPKSDEELMLLVGQGDQEACRTLVTRHLGRIHGFATRVMGNPDEGEDIAQEVFLRLWKHASRWQPSGAKLTTWLHRIALNLCLNKKEKRREILPESPPDMEDPRPEPALAAGQKEMQKHVNAALATLPTKQRAAITMCHYQGMSNAEAAEILDVSVEALESLLARGRRNMRSKLSELAGELLEGGIG